MAIYLLMVVSHVRVEAIICAEVWNVQRYISRFLNRLYVAMFFSYIVPCLIILLLEH